MNRLRQWFLLPGRVTMAVFFAAPLAITVLYSLLTRGTYGGQSLPWSVESYTRLIDSLYLSIVLKSVWIAAVSAAFCVVLGFPLALFIARSPGRRHLWLLLVMLPFWTSLLVRTYAWMFLLRDTGLINTALLALGWIDSPLPLLYNDFAVVLGLVYGYMPFAVLPIYAALERMDPALIDAAADLGARPFDAVRSVIVPLARPGIVAGAVLVFIPSLGTYLTSDLLGGGRSVLIGNVIQNQFTGARDWPFGAALSVGLMAIVFVLLLPRLRHGRSLL